MTNATKKEAKQGKTLKDLTQLALEKALDIDYGRILNTDGTPIKVRHEGYLGTKQFEVLDGAGHPEAQPGRHDVALVESDDGRYVVEFPMSLRPIGTIRTHGDGGTLRNAQSRDMGAGDAERLMKMALDRLNEIVAYGMRTGVASEICKRIANKIFEGRWLARNYCDDIKIIVRGENALKGHKFSTPEELANEIEAALFDTSCKNHLRQYTVRAEITAVKGKQIYPSQQMPLDISSKDAEGRLYVVDRNGGVMMTQQKIGHVIRTYDTWTVPSIDPDHPFSSKPIPVSAVSGHYRYKIKDGKGALSLIAASDAIAKADKPTPDDYYVLANIIHGGLFTKKGATDTDGNKSAKKNGKKAETIDASTGEIKAD